MKIVIATSGTVGLLKWIIDDTCPLYNIRKYKLINSP